MHEPKNTLAGAGYNVKASPGSIGWKIGKVRTLSVNPKEVSF